MSRPALTVSHTAHPFTFNVTLVTLSLHMIYQLSYHILINMFERSEIASEPKWLPGLQFSAAFEETQVELTDSGTQVAQRNAA